MKLSLKNSRAEFCVLIFTLLLIFLNPKASAQVISLDSLHVGEITCATTDIYSNLYLGDSRGQLVKIEPDPLRVMRYSGKQTISFDKIDAGSYNKIAVYSKDLQQVFFFDRNLSLLSRISVEPQAAATANCVCLSSGNGLWLFDESALSIKKLSAVSGQVLMTVNCSAEFHGKDLFIRDMKEYQNRLYLLSDNHVIYIFDNMGNFIKSLENYSDSTLQFVNNYLVSNKDQEFTFINLYDSTKDKKKINDVDPVDKVLITKNFLYLLSRHLIIRPLPEGIF